MQPYLPGKSYRSLRSSLDLNIPSAFVVPCSVLDSFWEYHCSEYSVLQGFEYPLSSTYFKNCQIIKVIDIILVFTENLNF